MKVEEFLRRRERAGEGTWTSQKMNTENREKGDGKERKSTYSTTEPFTATVE
jgi:hypothetical protein